MNHFLPLQIVTENDYIRFFINRCAHFLSDIYIKLVFIVYLEFLGTDYQQELNSIQNTFLTLNGN